MTPNRFIADWNERLMRAFAALDLRLLADPS